MSSDDSLLRRYRKSFIAILIFVGYAVSLLVHNLGVREQLRQNLIVPREELFAAARRHQELQKRDAEKAKEEPKEAPKAPGPRRLL